MDDKQHIYCWSGENGIDIWTGDELPCDFNIWQLAALFLDQGETMVWEIALDDQRPGDKQDFVGDPNADILIGDPMSLFDRIFEWLEFKYHFKLVTHDGTCHVYSWDEDTKNEGPQ